MWARPRPVVLSQHDTVDTGAKIGMITLHGVRLRHDELVIGENAALLVENEKLEADGADRAAGSGGDVQLGGRGAEADLAGDGEKFGKPGECVNACQESPPHPNLDWIDHLNKA